MNRRAFATTAFLALTAAALGTEVWFAYDDSPNTLPWTFLITDHIPAPITFLAIGVLVAWLPAHFLAAYATRRGTRTNNPTAKLQGGAVGNYLVSLIRTAVPAAVGAVLTWLAANFGIVINDQSSAQAVALVTALAIALYYAVVRMLELQWPWFGTLLGAPKQPMYVPAGVDPNATQPIDPHTYS